MMWVLEGMVGSFGAASMGGTILSKHEASEFEF